MRICNSRFGILGHTLFQVPCSFRQDDDVEDREIQKNITHPNCPGRRNMQIHNQLKEDQSLERSRAEKMQELLYMSLYFPTCKENTCWVRSSAPYTNPSAKQLRPIFTDFSSKRTSVTCPGYYIQNREEPKEGFSLAFYCRTEETVMLASGREVKKRKQLTKQAG